MFEFIPSLYLSFAFIALSGTGLLFSSTRTSVNFFGYTTLLGILINLLNRSLFVADGNAKLLAFLVWIDVTAFFIYNNVLNLKKPAAKPSALFYALPFLSVIFMSVSTDLITFLMAFTLFNASFLTLSFYKKKTSLFCLKAFKEATLAILTFSYGLSILYVTKGTIYLSDWTTLLKVKPIASFIWLGIGLLGLGVLMGLRLFLGLVNKKNA